MWLQVFICIKIIIWQQELQRYAGCCMGDISLLQQNSFKALSKVNQASYNFVSQSVHLTEYYQNSSVFIFQNLVYLQYCK